MRIQKARCEVLNGEIKSDNPAWSWWWKLGEALSPNDPGMHELLNVTGFHVNFSLLHFHLRTIEMVHLKFLPITFSAQDRTFRDIKSHIPTLTKIIRQLRYDVHKPWREIVDEEDYWPQDVPRCKPQIRIHYIKLGLFAWLQINAGFPFSQEHHLLPSFHRDKTVQENINAIFPSTTLRHTSGTSSEIEIGFTAANLVYFHGVRIKWTPFVNNHLVLETTRDAERILYFYPNFDEYLLEVSRPDNRRRVVVEITATMVLLFPKFDKASEKLLKKIESPQLYDDLHLGIIEFGVERLLPRNLDEFPIFGKRLAELLDLYRRPTTHWWHVFVDRRNKKEHATQLIAIWAFVFAFLSLVFGLISAIYGIKQYDLGIAAACADNSDHPALRYYCAKYSDVG